MNTYDNNKQQILKLFPLVREHVQSMARGDLIEHLNKSEKHLTLGQLSVVICGEFKRGKSSLINSLLETEKPLCPVDIDITTAIVTSISWAEEEHIVVVQGDSEDERGVEIKHEKIADYVTETGNPGNKRQIQRMEIQGPFMPLKSGLMLIDTPGLGGLNSEHGAVTYAILPEADVAVFVMDASTPLSQPELDFIQNWLGRYCQQIIYVMTGKDKRSDIDNAIADARNKIAHTLACDENTLTIIAVSNLLKQEYLQTRDEEDLFESNFPALEKALWGKLSVQAGAILLEGALFRLSEMVNSMLQPLMAEQTVYKGQAEDVTLEYKAKIEASREKLTNLQSERAEWLADLQEGIREIQSDLFYKLEEQTDDIKLRINQELNNKEAVDIVDELFPVITQFALDLRNNLKNQIKDLHKKLLDGTGLELNAPVFDEEIIEIGKPEKEKFKPNESWGRRVWNAIKSAGNLLVSIKLLFFNLPSALRKLSDDFKMIFGNLPQEQCRSILQDKFLRSNVRLIKKDIDKQLSTLRRDMQKDLKDNIQQEVESCNVILKHIQKASQVIPEEVSSNLVRVEQQIKQLVSLQARIKQLGIMLQSQSARIIKEQPDSKKTNQIETDYGDFADE